MLLIKLVTIGHYRENTIAIKSAAKDPFGGNVNYVTMQIALHIPEFARKERNLHCEVVGSTHYHQMGLSPHSGSPDLSAPDVAIKAHNLLVWFSFLK